MQERSRPRWALLLAALLCAGASLWLAFQEPVNDDDVYHLHSIWLTAHGAVPYRDFFEVHAPGMWVALAPAARLMSHGSMFLLLARVLTAALFGLSVWLAGAMVNARGLRAGLLALLSLLVLGRCQFYMFRAEYITAFLFMLHCWILTRDPAGGRTRRLHFFAAAAMSFACTMSIRPVVFLAIQPLVIFASRKRLSWARQVPPYVAGLVAGAVPCALFLTAHRLWADAWYWSIRFASSSEVVYWKPGSLWRYGMMLALGICAMIALRLDRRLPAQTRLVLSAAWVLAFLFYLVNPLRMPFSSVHLLLVSVTVASVIPGSVLESLIPRLAGSAPLTFAARSLPGLTMAIALIVVLYKDAGLRHAFDRRTQASQLQLMDWLQQISGGSPVLLIAPHHPIVVPDVADLQNAWEYCYWLPRPAVRQRLAELGSRILEQRPSVIAADPWEKNTGGRDLLDWLAANGLLREAEAIEAVSFPDLSGLPFGHTFWVRRDRLESGRLPETAVVRNLPAPPAAR